MIRSLCSALMAASILGLGAAPLAAQATGTVRGTVTRASDGSPLAGVVVTVRGTGISAVSSTSGQYTIDRAPSGPQTLVFRWLGYRPFEATVEVQPNGEVVVHARMETAPVTLADLVVSTASRAPERAVEAPAAITAVDPRVLRTTSITGQAPLALATVPGVDLAQNGVNDFNVNARGFNSSLNRRVLVLVDGRDVATAFLGSQEWNALPIPTEDIGRMEMVRGPGSALYGANAYAGVLAITTPTAREVVGTKLTVGGGELSTFKADLRHAGLINSGRWGYRLNGGFYRSDTWSRSRTLLDGSALRKEYTPVSDSAFRPACTSCARPELRALNGEVRDPATGAVSGSRDPLQNAYGSARVDYYADNGSVITAEAGGAQVENEVAVTGIGRVQITKTVRPYARLNWAARNFDVMAYWNGRKTEEPQYSLASGAGLEERSDVLHLEAQQNSSFDGDRGRFVLGGSFRSYDVNTSRTLINPANDDRTDYYYALFTQFEYRISDKVRGLLAARYDVGSLIDAQFSPKAALVVTPNDRHSFRFTINRAFQTPNYSEFFLNVAAGAPANFSALEAGLRANAQLGPLLAGVPVGQLFDNSAAVPVRARGNTTLDVEKRTGFEVGYRGNPTSRLYLSVDAYLDRLSDFVTDLLPGINPAFRRWTAPAAVPAAARAAVENAVRSTLLANPATATAGRGLTRQEDGKTAIVLSYGNAGSATQYGLELAAGLQITEEVRADAGVAFARFDINEDEQAAGDQLLPNTPRSKGHVSVNYNGRTGLDLGLTFRASQGYEWAAGVFAGWIEPQSVFDASAAYAVNNNLRLFVTGTNIFDQQRYAIYGGSVNGRRVLGGVTTRF
jgi:outer membrane receptor for ferrienterochelin and colicins